MNEAGLKRFYHTKSSISFSFRRLGVFASKTVSWGKYDDGWFKREFVDDDHPRWCYSFWLGSWGITIHWHMKKAMTDGGVKP